MAKDSMTAGLLIACDVLFALLWHKMFDGMASYGAPHSQDKNRGWLRWT
jgi:hypothetical protein